MNAFSATLRALLDEITEVLADGEPTPEILLTRLVALWSEERPADVAALSALLASLRSKPDKAKLDAALYDQMNRNAEDSLWSSWGDGYSDDPYAASRKTPVPTDGWLYPVFFGTNRAPRGKKPEEGFAAKRADSVNYGRCQVWIPKTHRFGEIGQPWWIRWKKLTFQNDLLKLLESEPLSEAEFWATLRAEMMVSEGSPQGLVFLHGYNVDFEAGAIRAAQLGFDLKVSGATAFFSWPSQGSLTAYAADAAAIEASEEAIASFLAKFVRESGAAKVHLVAHSMGNRGLLRALQRIAAGVELAEGVHFGQIFLAAPDVDRDLFLSLARLYPQFGERTTLYASESDKAIATSAWLHDAPRAGYLPPITVARGIDTVAVPGLDLDFLGHSYYAQAEALLNDMYDLTRHNSPPVERQRIDAKEGYWVMRH